MAVATLGSFRLASERLNTTQPAVSQRIAQLESDLGVRLLRRETRNVTPTPRGRELMIYAEKLLALRAETIAAIADPATLQGILRIGAAETIVHTWMPAFVERVSRVFPRLALEVEVDISPSLRDRLLTREIDLAFMMEPFITSEMVMKPLCKHQLAFIASPRIEVPEGVLRLEDLARHPIMTFSRRTKPYEAVHAVFNRPDLPRVLLHASASLATLIYMAEEGLGIAAIPPAIVRTHIASGRLRKLDTRVHFPDLSFCASWMPGVDARAAEQLADIAAEEAAAFHPRM